MTCRRFYIAETLRFGFAIPTNNLACIPSREVVTSGRYLPAVGIGHYSTAGVPIGLVEPLVMASVPTDRLAARIGQLICRRSSATVCISPEEIGCESTNVKPFFWVSFQQSRQEHHHILDDSRLAFVWAFEFPVSWVSNLPTRRVQINIARFFRMIYHDGNL